MITYKVKLICSQNSIMEVKAKSKKQAKKKAIKKYIKNLKKLQEKI